MNASLMATFQTNYAYDNDFEIQRQEESSHMSQRASTAAKGARKLFVVRFACRGMRDRFTVGHDSAAAFGFSSR